MLHRLIIFAALWDSFGFSWLVVVFWGGAYTLMNPVIANRKPLFNAGQWSRKKALRNEWYIRGCGFQHLIV